MLALIAGVTRSQSADGTLGAVIGLASGLRSDVETVIGYPSCVSVVETIVVFVGIPLALYGLLGLLTLRSKFAGSFRYRPGQEWNYPPVWWTANPHGLDRAKHHTASGTDAGSSAAAVRGGARGSW